MVDLYGKGVGKYTSPIHGMGFGEPQLATTRPTIAWSPGQLDSCSHVTAGNPRHTTMLGGCKENQCSDNVLMFKVDHK